MSGSRAVRIPLETGGATTALVYPAAGGGAIGATLMLAHGAGAGQESPFLVQFSHALAQSGLDIVTFDFPYMTEGRRVPDRGPVLEACYRAAITIAQQEIDSARQCLCIGGKSMGGRIATQIAAARRDCPIAGLVLLGYPLHPPNRPAVLRAAHLPAVRRPMLFVQGSRDGFGTPAELDAALAGLVPTPTLHVVDGGDHSLKVPRTSLVTQAAVYADVQRTIADWVKAIIVG